MRDLQNRVAVITGAASGLGLAMAERFASEGMKLVLADLPGGPLELAGEQLSRAGVDVLIRGVDVTDHGAVQAMADDVATRFGRLDLLCNNAGITGDRPRNTWEHDPTNWRRVLDVNLMGIIHGLHAFMPLLLENKNGAHVVNTSSMGGLSSHPFIGPYVAAKSAVVALSETLKKELDIEGASVGVSVLCPGMVRTGLTGLSRDRPESRVQEPTEPALRFQNKSQLAAKQAMVTSADVAGTLVEAIRDNRFFVLTHEGSVELARQRYQWIEIDNNTSKIGRPIE